MSVLCDECQGHCKLGWNSISNLHNKAVSINTVLTRLQEVEPPWAFPLSLLKNQSPLGIWDPWVPALFPYWDFGLLKVELDCTHSTAWSTVVLCKSDFIVCQAPLSVGFPRQEYSSGLPFPTPGHFPDSGIKPHLLHLLHWQEGSLPLHHLGNPNLMELSFKKKKKKKIPKNVPRDAT